MNKKTLPSLTLKLALRLGLALALGSGLAVGTNVARSQSAAGSATAKPALTVQTVQPQPAQWPQTINAVGSVAAWQEAFISAEVSGLRIQQLHANVGDRVKKGQLLATLSAGTLAADLAASRASLLDAQASAQDARATLNRMRPSATSKWTKRKRLMPARRPAWRA
jgi:HlyD family secretion protein